MDGQRDTLKGMDIAIVGVYLIDLEKFCHTSPLDVLVRESGTLSNTLRRPPQVGLDDSGIFLNGLRGALRYPDAMI
jgi:hypothetical protein